MTISGAVTTYYMRQHDTILLVQMLIASAALFNQKIFSVLDRYRIMPSPSSSVIKLVNKMK